METRLILAAGIAALAVPAIAQTDAPQYPMRPETKAMTRADVEAKVRERFAKADLNRDGAVTTEEVKQAAEQRRVERRGKIFDRLDADRNGQISRAEFEAAAGQRAEGGRGQMMRKRMMMRHAMRARMMGGAMFARADANKDGRVTLPEVLNPTLERFDRADANRDGTVTPEERRDARMKMREEWRAKRS